MHAFDSNLDLGLRVLPVLRHLRYLAVALREIDAMFHLQRHFPTVQSIEVVQNDWWNSIARREAGEVVLHNVPLTVCRESQISVYDAVLFEFGGSIFIPWELKEISRGGKYTSMVDDVDFQG